MNKEIRKEIIAKCPYLQPRNVWTDEIPPDYDFSYILGEYELPDGWFKLFLQMCVDIYEPLKREGLLDTFRFTQIKEKWGAMRCYTRCSNTEVRNIIYKYEHLSPYVCAECGKPATWTMQGYVIPYCSKCKRAYTKKFNDKSKRIWRKLSFKIESYSSGVKTVTKIPIKNEWKRYLRFLNGVV